MDGYSTRTPAFDCPWYGCPFASDDADETEAHTAAHDASEADRTMSETQLTVRDPDGALGESEFDVALSILGAIEDAFGREATANLTIVWDTDSPSGEMGQRTDS